MLMVTVEHGILRQSWSQFPLIFPQAMEKRMQFKLVIHRTSWQNLPPGIPNECPHSNGWLEDVFLPLFFGGPFSGDEFVTFSGGVTLPIGSMYGIYTYIWLIFIVNVGEYTIHGSYGIKNQILLMRWHIFFDVLNLCCVCCLEVSKLFAFFWWEEKMNLGNKKSTVFLDVTVESFCWWFFVGVRLNFMSLILQRFLEFAVAPAEHFLHIFRPVFSGFLLRGAAPKSHENEFICWVSQTIMVWGEKYPLAN